MIIGKKVRLHPTPEQEILFWKSAGTSRWAYNYFLGRQEEVYQESHESAPPDIRDGLA